MAIPVTLLYGGISALIVVVLGINVSRLRIMTKTHVSKPPPKELIRPIRAHANAAEWTPLLLILLGMLEMSHVASRPLHIFGGTIVGARLLHAFGVLGRNRSHIVAATFNYTLVTTMAIMAIKIHFAR
jgi:uncharacterized membrane protein YecN with MAPEG domain